VAPGAGAGVGLPAAGGSSALAAPGGSRGVGAIKSEVTKSEGEAVHNSLCCQLIFPWKICTRWEEQAAELLCSPAGCLSLGGTAAGNAAGSPRGHPRSCRKRPHSEKMGDHSKLYS